MKRNYGVVLAWFGLFAMPAAASEIQVGLISFDVLIPAGVSPGIDVFAISDFTGPVWGPFAAAPYVADTVSLNNATLTANLQGGGSLVFNLGDIPPGELLDGMGNPVVQVSSAMEFTSAILTATLSQTTFELSDGSTFTASPSIVVNLTPSSGNLLVADVDLAGIDANSGGAATPEPGTLLLLGCGLFGLFAYRTISNARAKP